MAENDVKLIQDAGAGIPRSRTIQTLNAITDAASFRSAFGIGTGTGDVTSVNNITPDGSGDVSLSAADVGAVALGDIGTIASLAAPAISDLAAVTAVPHGPAPFEYNKFKSVTTDLTLTDDGTPNEGDGYRLILINDGTAHLITIPTSYSEAQGSNIASFYLLANQQVTIVRQYINATWRIYGDPAYEAYTPDVLLLRSFGSTSVATTADLRICNNPASFSASGTLILSAISVKKPMAVGGLRYQVCNNPNFTASSNNKIAIFSRSGGVLTLVAASDHSSSTWNPGDNTWTFKNFNANPVIMPGQYYVGGLYVATNTTAPQILGTPVAENANVFEQPFVTTDVVWGCSKGSETDIQSSYNLSDFTTVATSIRYFELFPV
jgi:hypothetical protein